MKDSTFYEYAKVIRKDRLSWWQKLLGRNNHFAEFYLPTEQAIDYEMESSHLSDVEIEPMPKGWKSKNWRI